MNSAQISGEIEQYMETFTERELRGYAIAKSHLGNSFQLDKSVGYQKWSKEHITHMPPSTQNFTERQRSEIEISQSDSLVK